METFSSLETPAGQHALKCLLLCKVCRGLNNVTVQLVKIASRASDTFVWSSYVCICMQRFLLTLSAGRPYAYTHAKSTGQVPLLSWR